MQDEVLVLGGGVAGCAASIALARKGRSVTLIEENPPPTGVVDLEIHRIGPELPNHDAGKHGLEDSLAVLVRRRRRCRLTRGQAPSCRSRHF